MTTIMHLIDTTGPGGAEDVFITLADQLRHHQLDSLVVIRGEGYVADTLRARGLEPVIIPAKGSFNVKLVWRLARLVLKHRVSLIQSHLLGSNVYAAITGLVTGTPVVATYHGMVDVAPDERFRRLKRTMMKWGIKRYVAVSDSLSQRIQQLGLLDAIRTRVIYNGIDVAAYAIEPSNALREQLQIPVDSLLIGALGNIRQPKRYDVLLDALAKCHGERPVVLAIAGDPKAKLIDALKQQAKDLGLEQVHFLGFVSDTPAYLAGLDLFVLCSDSEGFSISTIEALACGLPMVLTRCGGPEEIIGDSRELAHFASPADSDDLAAKLTQAMQAIDKGETRSAAARAWVTQRFSMEAMLAGYLSVYRELGVDCQVPQLTAEEGR
ncbi:glycosyltransferase [Aliagarivorans taiwanensis]|uniref:glycosyltransferase n=1 Tax=Aliagarivorans taiwanensis TaxID=561966 RepID=UPI000421BC53|nr:glycosyltransferase [Aliagarivorans taiwanensis]